MGSRGVPYPDGEPTAEQPSASNAPTAAEPTPRQHIQCCGCSSLAGTNHCVVCGMYFMCAGAFPDKQAIDSFGNRPGRFNVLVDQAQIPDHLVWSNAARRVAEAAADAWLCDNVTLTYRCSKADMNGVIMLRALRVRAECGRKRTPFLICSMCRPANTIPPNVHQESSLILRSSDVETIVTQLEAKGYNDKFGRLASGIPLPGTSTTTGVCHVKCMTKVMLWCVAATKLAGLRKRPLGIKSAEPPGKKTPVQVAHGQAGSRRAGIVRTNGKHAADAQQKAAAEVIAIGGLRRVHTSVEKVPNVAAAGRTCGQALERSLLDTLADMQLMRERGDPEEEHAWYLEETAEVNNDTDITGIDFLNVFGDIPVKKSEWRSFTTNQRSKVIAVLRATQGSRKGPLLRARTAAFSARMGQSLRAPGYLRVKPYVDDPVIAARGTSVERNGSSTMVLLTWQALGVDLAWNRAQRGLEAMWMSASIKISKHIVTAAVKAELFDVIRDSWVRILKRNLSGLKELRTFAERAVHAARLGIDGVCQQAAESVQPPEKPKDIEPGPVCAFCRNWIWYPAADCTRCYAGPVHLICRRLHVEYQCPGRMIDGRQLTG